MLVAPEPVWRGIAGRARQAPRGPVIAGALAVAALGVGAAAVTAAALDGRLDFALVTPTDSVAASPAASVHEASAAATPRPTPRPSATPTASASGSSAPSPSLAATPAPTLAATPAPEPPQVTPAPPPTQQTYTVQEGDTLALIAEQFGTTVDALQAANGIEEPDEIVIGQVLVIP
jgi:LysM repeat protein